jgi:predicted short-subunit dehydrogenase-like oxidoreductase (DUF2520 family)
VTVRAWTELPRTPKEPGAVKGDRSPGDAGDPAVVGARPALPRIGFVGAGRVGLGLGIAFQRAGWPVVAVSTRDPSRRERFTRLVPGSIALPSPQDLLDAVDVVFLTVPDDATTPVAAALRLYGGQAIVHTNGLLASDALRPALAAGSMAGSFHPLVAFADPEAAVAALRGSTIAIEGDRGLISLLDELARSVGAGAVHLEAAQKPAYHAAAVLAAGGFVGLLDAIAELGAVFGLDERAAIALYEPLLRRGLENAGSIGVASALTGPAVRGDAGTVAAHVAAIRRDAPATLEIYRVLLRRQIAIAQRRGDLEEGRAAALLEALGGLS